MKLILENPKPLNLEWRLDPVMAGLHGASRSPNYYSFSGDRPWVANTDPLAAITELQVAFDEYVSTVRGLIDGELARLMREREKESVDELAAAVAEGKAVAERIATLSEEASA